jgi:enoyl-CoA hydratase
VSDVEIEIRDGIAALTLNAPERRNSLTQEMARDIVRACDTVEADSEVGAMVVRANGTVFCSGADRSLLAEASKDPCTDRNYAALGQVYEAFTRIARMGLPTISAVQGAALGAGLNLALSSDLCLVAPDARLLSGFLPIGVHPGGGHFSLLNSRVGPQIAAAMGLFGYELLGEQAVVVGLAFEAHPADMLDARAFEMAAVAAADPTLSRRATESMRLQFGSSQSQQTALRIEQSAQMWSLRRRGGSD